MDSGKIVRTFTIPKDNAYNDVECLLTTRKGDRIFASSMNFNVYAIDMARGESTKTVYAGEPVFSMCLSRDEKILIIGVADVRVDFWDIESERRIHSIPVSSIVYSSCISPKDENCLIFSSGQDVILYDIKKRSQTRKITRESQINSLSVSSDGTFLVIGLNNSEAAQLDLQSGKEIKTFVGHTDEIKSVCLTPDDTHLITGSYDYTAIAWHIESGRRVRTFSAHNDIVHCICVTPDGRFFVTASHDKTANLWRFDRDSPVRTFRGHTQEVYTVVATHDGQYILTGSEDESIIQWDISDLARDFVARSTFLHCIRTISEETDFNASGISRAYCTRDVCSVRYLMCCVTRFL